MRTWITRLLILSVVCAGLQADAAAKKSKKAAKKATTPKSELSTNVEFDPMTVHGRYQYAAEGLAKVEDEKALYDLLGPRKNFKDRMKQMARQK
jgi:hypothetical protein